MDSWTKAIPYFSEEELRCKGSGALILDIRFAIELPKLRKSWRNTLYLTSVCRSPEYNKQVGGHPNSLHLTENPKWQTAGTMAADIYWENWDLSAKYEFYILARELNWSCGLDKQFIHCDRRYDIGLGGITFTYPSWTNDFARVGDTL